MNNTLMSCECPEETPDCHKCARLVVAEALLREAKGLLEEAVRELKEVKGFTHVDIITKESLL